MSSREYATSTSGTGSWFVACRFDLDKKFNELVGCLAFDSDWNLSLSTDDHDIDTDSSLESLISFGNLCKLTPLARFCTARSYKCPHHCPAEMMVELVNHTKTAASIIYFPLQWCTIIPT